MFEIFQNQIVREFLISQPIQVNSINNNIIKYSQSGFKIRAYGNSIFIIFMMSNSNNYESKYLSTSEDNGNTWIKKLKLGLQIKEMYTLAF